MVSGSSGVWPRAAFLSGLAMEVKYYIHVHEQTKGMALGRVYGGVREVIFHNGYPEQHQDEALEWFHLYVDATVVCSDFEWWCLNSEWPGMEGGHPGARSKLAEAVQEAFGGATPAEDIPALLSPYRRG